MRTSLVVLVCLGLAGCSDSAFGPGVGVSGVAPPSSGEISAASQELDDVKVSPIAYMLTSLAITDERCDEFFKKLDKLKSDSSLANDVIAAAITVATPLQASKVVQVLNAASTVNTNLPKLYFFADHASGLHRHVREAMASYRQTHGLSYLSVASFGLHTPHAHLGQCAAGEHEVQIATGTDGSGRPILATYCANSSGAGDPLLVNHRTQMAVARSVAVNYASYCTVPGIDDIVNEIFGNTDTKTKGGMLGDPAGTVTEKSTAK